ncbi:nickel pincer cofactor biosynthesis protein LarC [Desulfotomaculum sp. 1211_IL3151]|uniref:nickel pincer cofactor biosynthesis protein LarC n=1 Tax=Desulfotomaculum sp. 1211_IL3151 TaxID=3084055 RepID=UPI002FD918B7
MSIIYFDCFSGISGDMIIGALLDAGLPFRELEEELAKLNLANFQIKSEKVIKKGITATKFSVVTDEQQPHRHIGDIHKIIQESSLEEPIQGTVMKIFNRLAEAEGKIHGVSPEKIHFHEVGAVDAIVDIVGAVVSLHKMNITKITASPLNVGGGWTHCMHGLIPVPAPATLELLKGIPIYNGGVNRELVTPTGAAIISALCQDFTDLPAMIPGQIGYGAGTAELRIPNALRVIVGEEKHRHEHGHQHHKHTHN